MEDWRRRLDESEPMQKDGCGGENPSCGVLISLVFYESFWRAGGRGQDFRLRGGLAREEGAIIPASDADLLLIAAVVTNLRTRTILRF